MFRLSICLVAIFSLYGCASVHSRIKKAEVIANNNNFRKEIISTDSFEITTYFKIIDKKQPINVYIEGDGLAWVTRHRRSSNPTPDNPVALRLAVADSSANVVYVGRPCQFIPTDSDAKCSPKYWSGSRFSPEVVGAIHQVINHFVSDSNQKMQLVGYSGGAAIATLLAAIRSDVVRLITVAGNLDHEQVNRHHNVSLLDNSLNPIDFVEQIKDIPQLHVIGERDTVIPKKTVIHFINKLEQLGGCAKVLNVEGATHGSGWLENWSHTINNIETCSIL